ncbi:MAG: hypothetical protein DRG78_09275 [Epsilonproteobacteria bacterium]|nr:MAG: hypothetical protein DRG78_09275 [Campylobacterota bacterium]
MIEKSIECTNKYLEFSSQNESQKLGRLQDIVGVVSNTPKLTEDGGEFYEIELNKPLKDNEFLIRDKHNSMEYMANRDFKVLLVNRVSNKLFVTFINPLVKLPSGIKPNMEISYDLKVLVLNQQTLLKEHSFDIAVPTLKPTQETSAGYQYVERFEHPSLPNLNHEQEQAVQMMLMQPLSFIKGAPGVGKTLTVAIPILSYISKGIPVAIITPTNVSLDRSMSAINDLCISVGIDLQRVVRLGTSSAFYADAYPQTLESPDAQSYLKQEELDLLLLETALEYRSLEQQIKKRDEIITVEMLLEDMLPQVQSLEKASQDKRISLIKMVGIKIKMVLSELTTEALKDLIGDINYQNFSERYEDFKKYAQQLVIKVVPLTKKERDLLRINSLNSDSYGNRIELYEELIGVGYDHLSEVDINKQISQVKEKITNFEKEYSTKKVQQAYLTGMTADSYNSRFKNEPLNVQHIFIDEGGYMPIIKVFGMCRSNIPLSILGDPNQLPPVSDMKNEITEGGKYEAVLLYGMSAFYLATLFEYGYEGLKRTYFKNKDADLANVPVVELVKTHRFGNKLADVLDAYVYKNGFTSALGDGGFKLEYIDAVNERAHGSRINHAEANTIYDILSSNKLDGSIAILTPYKNQVSHIKKTTKGLVDPNQIMSIHRSQGQEWDTVIISVVDYQSRGSYGMWFTSSKNKMSEGLKVINTAVSRAKTRLILVGHYGFWVTQKDELLGELFRNAQKLDTNQYKSVA